MQTIRIQRHGVGDVQSSTEILSAQRDQRDSDLIVDVRNILLFDGSLPRGSQIEGDIPGRTLAMNENTEALNNVSSSLYTAQSCPIQQPHARGIFLARGDVPRTRNGYWGYSDPPHEMWQAWNAIEQERATDIDRATVYGFAASHFWAGPDA